MTQSEVPRWMKPGHGRENRAGALSIGAFERGRWRLRRTRHLWVFNRFGDVWEWQFAVGAGRECIAPHRERRHRRAWKLGWGALASNRTRLAPNGNGFPPAWAHVEPACHSTL